MLGAQLLKCQSLERCDLTGECRRERARFRAIYVAPEGAPDQLFVELSAEFKTFFSYAPRIWKDDPVTTGVWAEPPASTQGGNDHGPMIEDLRALMDMGLDDFRLYQRNKGDIDGTSFLRVQCGEYE